MRDRVFYSSLSRISDLRKDDFETEALPRERWKVGDYAVARVSFARGELAHVELDSGRMARLADGELVLGAFGIRHATLEVVGTYEKVGDDGAMELLTSGGLFGKATSVSRHLPALVQLAYVGHVTRGGVPVRMADFLPPPPKTSYDCPTILIVGTSMSAGKTTSACIVVRALQRAGLRVVGAKLTGAGRYRDILSMSDAGADAIYDFVDVGLPSSIGPEDLIRERTRRLLGLIASEAPDVVVAEAGASPLEPYNGDTVIEELEGHVKMTILCASDPYAVVGVIQGFDMRPDLVAGLATSTTAGVEVVEKLSGIPALNLLDPSTHAKLAEMIENHLAR